jgi:hypothetical protein
MHFKLHSLTRITYYSKLIGMNQGPDRRQPPVVQIRSGEFVVHLPRDSASGLSPSGPAQALFKTGHRFVLQRELGAFPAVCERAMAGFRTGKPLLPSLMTGVNEVAWILHPAAI